MTILLKQQNRTDWYLQAIEQLVDIVQDLSLARDLPAIMGIVRKAARDLTGADGATLVLRDGEKCYYADENAISPLWKGQRFPLRSCISGWVMLNAAPVMIEDIYEDPRIPVEAYRPTFVKSLAMVPIRTNDPIGAIGNYWATQRRASDEEISILQALADVTSVAIENAELYTKLQKQIRALEISNSELNRFAWAASHDLKSPLRAIDNLARWIEEDIKEGNLSKVSEHLGTLRGRVHRMEKLLDDVLEYAQIENKSQQEGETVSGSELLKDVLNLIEIPDGFIISVSKKFDSLMLPRMPLQQIFCNLISNAIMHHDKPRGNVRIEAEEEEARYIFRVIDDGPGIEPQFYQKIFEMFSTLQPRDMREGSGMGLAFVKKIIDAHGAHITVNSPPGGGSEFRFTWPKTLQL